MIRKLLLAAVCTLCLIQMASAQSRELLDNGLYRVNNAGLYGLQDGNGNVIVSAEYEDITFYEGIAILIKGDHVYGRVNDAGEKVFFEKPYYFNRRYPFYSEGYLVVGKPVPLMKDKLMWTYIDEYGAPIDMKKKNFSYAEPFFAGYAVVRDFVPVGTKEGVLRHIDVVGNEHFKIDAKEIKHRSAVYWGGKDTDRCECVIITDTGIHLCQEDGDAAVIKETLYRGSTVQRYEDPYSFTDASGGALLFNEKGQAEVYQPEGGEMRWFIPLP